MGEQVLMRVCAGHIQLRLFVGGHMLTGVIVGSKLFSLVAPMISADDMLGN